MSISRKYGRTYHYPFSPGTTSDDRINHDYWNDVQKIASIVHTEKLDGENNCLSRYGVFARSHAAPSQSPWTAWLRERWELLKNDLNDLAIFGENLYAIHSIQYQRLENHYYVFGARLHDKWLSWEETKFYANMLDFPTVPEISIVQPKEKEQFEQNLLSIVSQAGTLGTTDAFTGEPSTMEGVVSRNTGEYPVDKFAHHVFKYVRKSHVKTDEHWTRNWKRAPLIWEKGSRNNNL
jgi:hypothetical protein